MFICYKITVLHWTYCSFILVFDIICNAIKYIERQCCFSDMVLAWKSKYSGIKSRTSGCLRLLCFIFNIFTTYLTVQENIVIKPAYLRTLLIFLRHVKFASPYLVSVMDCGPISPHALRDAHAQRWYVKRG